MSKKRNTNSVTITGNLVSDPQSRTVPSGASLCEFRLAVNNGETKEGKEIQTTYVGVTVWNGQGANCQKYLSKGRPVAVTGKLSYSEWEAEDGSMRSKLYITASLDGGVEFLNARVASEEAAPAAVEAMEDIPF